MIIHVYTMVHNEEVLMPYFMRHYAFADKITVLDNESVDRTAEIAKAAGAHVFQIDTGGYHRVEILQRVMDFRYRESRGKADWVIFAEGDEFLWHQDLRGLLEGYMKRGITFPKVQGFNMVSDAPPSGTGQIYHEIKLGVPDKEYSKRVVFNPALDVRFSPGGHKANATGPVVESEIADIKLLHYKYLGPQYFQKRYEEHRRRLSLESIKNRWGLECLQDHLERYKKEVGAASWLLRQVVS